MARPQKSTSAKTVTVPGDYSTFQSAVDNELPFIIDHTITFKADGGIPDEDFHLPPYMATWNADFGGKPAIVIDGKNRYISSFHAMGGNGLCRVQNMNLTGQSPYDDEYCAVSAYQTDKVELVNCSIDNNKRAMIAYTGVIGANGVEVNSPGWGIKSKFMGKYIEFGNNATGSADPAYEFGTGYMQFNTGGNGRISGQVRADKWHDTGVAIDAGNNDIYGAKEIRSL